MPRSRTLSRPMIPISRRRTKVRRARMGRLLLSAILLLGLTFLVRWILTTPALAIQQVNLQCVDAAITPVLERKMESLQGRNILITGPRDIRFALAEERWIRDFQCTRSANGILNVEILARTPLGVFKHHGQIMAIDVEGVAWPVKSAENLPRLSFDHTKDLTRPGLTEILTGAMPLHPQRIQVGGALAGVTVFLPHHITLEIPYDGEEGLEALSLWRRNRRRWQQRVPGPISVDFRVSGKVFIRPGALEE